MKMCRGIAHLIASLGCMYVAAATVTPMPGPDGWSALPAAQYQVHHYISNAKNCLKLHASFSVALADCIDGLITHFQRPSAVSTSAILACLAMILLSNECRPYLCALAMLLRAI